MHVLLLLTGLGCFQQNCHSQLFTKKSSRLLKVTHDCSMVMQVGQCEKAGVVTLCRQTQCTSPTVGAYIYWVVCNICFTIWLPLSAHLGTLLYGWQTYITVVVACPVPATLVCSTSQLALHLGLYTHSLVSLTYVWLRIWLWCANPIVMYSNKQGIPCHL